jgi:hypothetical protein
MLSASEEAGSLAPPSASINDFGQVLSYEKTPTTGIRLRAMPVAADRSDKVFRNAQVPNMPTTDDGN